MPVYTPGPDTLTGTASVFVVFRYDRTKEGDARFEFLPNVQCLSITTTTGPIPQSAQFAYVLDDSDPSSPFPRSLESLWPGGASGPYAVKQDDELIVYEYTDGFRRLVFDGFAVLPQVDQGQGLSAHFMAAGVGVRLADSPIAGAVYRDSDTPRTGAPVATELPVWFNPMGRPNRTPDGFDVGEGEPDAYPVFLDATLPAVPGAEPPLTPDSWTLGSYTRYLSRTANPDETWVKNVRSATGAPLDDYLKVPSPAAGVQFMNFADPTTFDLNPVTIRSFDATTKTLPQALNEQLSYYGFELCFDTREDPDDPGAPLNELIVYRVDGLDANAAKELYYPAAGSSLAAGLPSFNAFGVVRDAAGVVNEYQVQTESVGHEVSVVFAPGFTPNAADAVTAVTMNAYLSSMIAAAVSGASAAVRDKYRRFVFDECGVGHWDFTSADFVTGEVTSLDGVLGGPDPDTDVRRYVNRFRPGENTLFSLDNDGHPRKAELSISYTYAGTTPGVWDGSNPADWRSLGQSGWKLDDQALGVVLTCDSPASWKLPVATGTGGDTASGDTLNVIRAMSDPEPAPSPNRRFFLRLTCVIPGDFGVGAVAPRRPASPGRFTVRRVIDSKDHWQKQVIHKSSRYNTSGEEKVVRDDTAKARAQAKAQRSVTEFPSVAGSFTVPWVTHAYGIGDAISRVNGKDIDLNTAAGGEAGEGQRYPAVESVTWDCQNQTTTVLLSDKRSAVEDANHGWGRSR